MKPATFNVISTEVLLNSFHTREVALCSQMVGMIMMKSQKSGLLSTCIHQKTNYVRNCAIVSEDLYNTS